MVMSNSRSGSAGGGGGGSGAAASTGASGAGSSCITKTCGLNDKKLGNKRHAQNKKRLRLCAPRQGRPHGAELQSGLLYIKRRTIDSREL